MDNELHTGPFHDGSARNQLLDLALTRLGNGSLPRTAAPRIYAGPAHDESCSLCGFPIRTGEIGYEVNSPSQGGAVQEYCFHIFCFHAWREACEPRLRT